MDDKVLRPLRAIYTDLERRFKVGGGLGLPFKPTNGILQGCPLSVILINLLQAVWTRAVKAETQVDAISYADDATILGVRPAVQAAGSITLRGPAWPWPSPVPRCSTGRRSRTGPPTRSTTCRHATMATPFRQILAKRVVGASPCTEPVEEVSTSSALPVPVASAAVTEPVKDKKESKQEQPELQNEPTSLTETAPVARGLGVRVLAADYPTAYTGLRKAPPPAPKLALL